MERLGRRSSARAGAEVFVAHAATELRNPTPSPASGRHHRSPPGARPPGGAHVPRRSRRDVGGAQSDDVRGGGVRSACSIPVRCCSAARCGLGRGACCLTRRSWSAWPATSTSCVRQALHDRERRNEPTAASAAGVGQRLRRHRGRRSLRRHAGVGGAYRRRRHRVAQPRHDRPHRPLQRGRCEAEPAPPSSRARSRSAPPADSLIDGHWS